MTLTVLIDNRTVSFAFFEKADSAPQFVFRIAARPARTSDEYAALLYGMPQRPAAEELQRAIIASVVPPLTAEIIKAIRLLYPDAICLTVGAGLRTGLTLRTDAPAELGADLVAMAAGAVSLKNPPCLVLNCGDVITLSAIGRGKDAPEYLGCAILPGAALSVQALKEQAALLSTVALTVPSHSIGKNTGDSVRSGVLLGLAAAIERLISDFEAEMKAQALPLVVTGDEAEPLLPLLSAPYLFEKDLAHKGLHHLALLNEKKSGNPPKRV